MPNENTIPKPDSEDAIQDLEAVVFDDIVPEPDNEDALQDPEATEKGDK